MLDRARPLVRSVTLAALVAATACTATGSEDEADRSAQSAACGTVLGSFDGTIAYSNGVYQGTGTACAGWGAYGLQYQCVELVMRHFKTHWGLSWLGNAADLLNNAPRDRVDVYWNGDRAHPPVPGDMIVWGTNLSGYGHVALVMRVYGGGIDIIQQNVGGAGAYATLPWDGATARGPVGWGLPNPIGWAHAKANTSNAPAPAAPVGLPAQPTGLTTEIYASRVALKWAASSGATSYRVTRGGRSWTTTSTSFVDHSVSPGQTYSYQVAAVNSAGSSAVAGVRASTTSNAADRAFVRLKTGLAECARAGDASSGSLVCNALSGGVWTRSYYATGDWGYRETRAWVSNQDGSVSYCRAVGTGSQVRCDTFNGSSWSTATSGALDLGYASDRAYVTTKLGPALCGRAGNWPGNQSLVCNQLNLATGAWSRTYAGAGDWGYESDRTWLTNKNGTASYCATVGTGNQWMCRTFNGSSFVTSTSGATDPGYGDSERTVLPTKLGPAACGRAGDPRDNPSLVCNVLNLATGAWNRVYSGRGDWGYDTDRAWVANHDGTASYCATVGAGNQLRCDTFDGASFRGAVSWGTDVGYGDANRVFIAAKNGPAECARAGGSGNPSLVCNALNLVSNTWTTTFLSAVDWGYEPERTWLETAGGNVSYCRTVGTGNQLRCDTFDGASFNVVVSGATDPGYPQGS